MSQPARQRLSELDALRGLAACMVVVYHYTQHLEAHVEHAPAWTGHRALSWLWPFDAGEHGVALFFVISGFVIFMTLERTKGPADFLVSRFARLYPAYWGGMFLTAAVRELSPVDDVTAGQVLVNATMVAGWFGVPFIDGVYWTLVVELQFYLIMLGASLAGLLSRIEWFCVGWFGLAFAALIAPRLGVPASFAESLSDVFILPHAMLFAAGMMFYRMFDDRPTLLRVAIVAAALAGAWVASDTSKAIVVTLTFAVFGAFVAGRLGILKRSKVLLFLGKISYPLYLVHLTIGVHVMKTMASWVDSTAVLFVVPVAVSIGLSTLLHLWIEEPARGLVRGWYTRVKGRARPQLA